MIAQVKKLRKQDLKIDQIHSLINKSAKEPVTVMMIKREIVSYYFKNKHRYKNENDLKSDIGYSSNSITTFIDEVSVRKNKPKHWKEYKSKPDYLRMFKKLIKKVIYL